LPTRVVIKKIVLSDKTTDEWHPILYVWWRRAPGVPRSKFAPHICIFLSVHLYFIYFFFS